MPTINPELVADVIDPGVGGDVELSAYGVMVSEDPAPVGAARRAGDRRPKIPGPHLSYAIQWILFALMGFVFIGYIIRTELRHRREDVEERKPRDRDMQDEDSILDAAGR